MLLHQYCSTGKNVKKRRMGKDDNVGNDWETVTVVADEEDANGNRELMNDGRWGSHSTIVEIHGLIKSTGARGKCRCLDLEACCAAIGELDLVEKEPDGFSLFNKTLGELIVATDVSGYEPNNRVFLGIDTSGYYSGRGPQVPLRQILESIINILEKHHGSPFIVRDTCVTHRY